MKRRVVITGIGIISPLGLSAAEHWNALLSLASGIGPISAFEITDFPVRFVAEVKGFKANKFIKNRKSIKIMARDIQLAVAASGLAAREGGVSEGTDDPGRFGVSMGAGLISSDVDELGVAVSASLDEKGSLDTRKYGREGLGQLFPLWLLKNLPNMLNSHASLEYDAQGPNNCITAGNAAGLLAIGEAARVIERDQADLMLAGSAESKINPLSMARLYLNGKLSEAPDLPERGPRPLCADRRGLALGEAGAVLLLEELEHARERSATVFAEVAGFGSSCGTQLVEEIDEDGEAARRAMSAALGDAGAGPSDVDAVFANASGLPEDESEARAIARTLGEGGSVTTTKAAAGHSMACAGALDCATAALALSNGTIPGVFGVGGGDGGPIDLVAQPRRGDFAAFLVNAFSFGGQTASLLLRKYANG
ncbi:MAG: beta-ketoacyl-[acyl-carrier-protein] synthase family protein [Planctomycetota bacterium]|jgi:3-oxoacyl-[acyl-carrier-protein] synthase II